jgi:hypothetical protein
MDEPSIGRPLPSELGCTSLANMETLVRFKPWPRCAKCSVQMTLVAPRKETRAGCLIAYKCPRCGKYLDAGPQGGPSAVSSRAHQMIAGKAALRRLSKTLVESFSSSFKG